MSLDTVADWEQAGRRFAAAACEYSDGALSLVNVARHAFGAGGLAEWPDGTPWDMHPLKAALTPCGVELLHEDGTLEVLTAEAPQLVRAWYPFSPQDFLDMSTEHDGTVEIAVPSALAIWVTAFDLAALCARVVANARERGAA